MQIQNHLTAARRRNAEHAVHLYQRRAWYSEATLPAWDSAREQATQGMEKLVSAVDNLTAGYLSGPADDAFEKAAKIAADKRLTPEAKRADIKALFDDARAVVEQRYADELADMDAKKPKLEQLAIGPASPKPEEAAALLYARDSLTARTQGMSDGDVQKLWAAALASGDLTTARVLSDFLPSWRWQRNGQPQTPPAWFDELREATERKLMTPEQIKARETLTADKSRRTALSILKGRAMAKIHAGFQIERDGTLTDGPTANHRRDFRNGW